MLPKASRPSRPTLFLAGIVVLAVISTARGQEADGSSPYDYLWTDVVSVAEAPAEKAAPTEDEVLEGSSLLAARRPIIRMAGMPNMFGDSFQTGAQILGGGGSGNPFPMWTPYRFGNRMYYYLADLPPLGGARRMKISENNKALPMDRVYFTYNHFHNSLESIVPPAGPFSVDQYTVGFEKTFCCGLYSAEVFMPLVGEFAYEEPGLRIANGNVGNLGFVFKRLLWTTQTGAAAAGLTLDVPTGSDLIARTPTEEVALRNDAVHLGPYVGFLRVPNDVIFYQGFLQLDLAANSNRVQFNGLDVGKYTEQNLLFVDLCLGRWLYRDPSASRFRGLAAVLEYHYTTTLQDADVVGYEIQGNWIELRNLHNRMDVQNLTVGLHAQVGKTTIRLGGVLPLEDSDRLFDAEVQLSINRYFGGRAGWLGIGDRRM
jgi:hypothetical protein